MKEFKKAVMAKHMVNTYFVPKNDRLVFDLDSKVQNEMLDALRLVFDKLEVSWTSKNRYVWQALLLISECQNDNEIQDQIMELEADDCFMDLAEWLGEDESHAIFLQEAVDNRIGGESGVEILMQAQLLCKTLVTKEVYRIINILN